MGDMLNNIDIEHIKKTKWYRQGGAIRLFYVFGPYHSIHETLGYDKCIIYQKGDVNTAFFDRDKQMKLTEDFIKKQKKDRNYISRWISDWKKKNRRLLDYCKKSLAKQLTLWTDKQLVDFLRKYQKLAVNFWKKGVLCEWTDPDGANILRRIISEFGAALDDDEIALLTAPEELTFVQKEMIERVKLAQKKIIGKNIKKDLEKFAAKYHWIKNNWAYIYELNSKYFSKLILEDIVFLKDRTEEVKKLKNYVKIIKRKKERTKEKKRVPKELDNVLYMFTRLTDWRDERKKMSVCLPNFYLHKILKRISEINNIPENIIGNLLYSEVDGWRLSENVKRKIKKRSLGWARLYTAKGKSREYFYPYAKELFDFLIKTLDSGEIKGIAANQGKAIGLVRIIEVEKDFKKMKKGDIIVATMTRPEYVSIMKMAGAIVTNEGGVTCHAAIVSRELGIPCIIGTQVATEVLKDGDMVEVDANSGIVTKIN